MQLNKTYSHIVRLGYLCTITYSNTIYLYRITYQKTIIQSNKSNKIRSTHKSGLFWFAESVPELECCSEYLRCVVRTEPHRIRLFAFVAKRNDKLAGHTTSFCRWSDRIELCVRPLKTYKIGQNKTGNLYGIGNFLTFNYAVHKLVNANLISNFQVGWVVRDDALRTNAEDTLVPESISSAVEQLSK